jgi:hypothetical protein
MAARMRMRIMLRAMAESRSGCEMLGWTGGSLVLRTIVREAVPVVEVEEAEWWCLASKDVGIVDMMG